MPPDGRKLSRSALRTLLITEREKLALFALLSIDLKFAMRFAPRRWTSSTRPSITRGKQVTLVR